MQRTVNSIKFTYAKNALNDDGTLPATLADVTIANETNEKTAYRKAVKRIGVFTPLKTEKNISALQA